MRDQVFISYSHKDQKWLQKLHTHLKPFERTHKIQVWDDTSIGAGTKWRDEIETALNEAKVAVLLVSPNYLASDFIAYQELPPMLAAAESEGLKVIWVAVSASAYLETNIKDYQAANDPTRPLDCLKPAKLNEALVKICEAIRTAVDDMPADCAEPAAATRMPVRRSRARAAKPEQEAETMQAAPASRVAPTSQAAPTLQAPARTPPSTEDTRRTSRFNSKLLFVVGGVILALVIGGIFVYSRLKDGATPQPKPAVPLLTDEFHDEFLNMEKWTPPPAGWSINKSEGQGSLFVDKPEVGFATKVNCGECTVAFNIKLHKNAGASWALRVKDPNNYYAFSLSGPDGLEFPDRFVSYIVRDGKRDAQSVTHMSFPIPNLLKEGHNYYLKITVEKDRITHILQDTNGTGKEIELGSFFDRSNVDPHGSVGFLALDNQKFSVDEIWVRPPGIKLPE